MKPILTPTRAYPPVPFAARLLQSHLRRPGMALQAFAIGEFGHDGAQRLGTDFTDLDHFRRRFRLFIRETFYSTDF